MKPPRPDRLYRPYHFPPLAQVAAGAAPAAAGQWQRSLADGFEQGRRDGYAQGFDSGRADGELAGHAAGLALGEQQGRLTALAAYEGAARPLDALFHAFSELERDVRAAQRQEVVALVGNIARQVIRAELALQPVQLLALVDEALAAMPPAREQVEVCLNPEEMRRITELDPVRAAKWKLLADPGLEAGECRVRAGDFEVDAGCQGRLAACMDQVRAQLQSATVAATEALAA